MNFKANYEIIPLVLGNNSFPVVDNINSIHEVYCISAGAVTITAEGGGTATFTLGVNQSINIVTRKINVVSGSFIGFRAKS